MDPDTLKLLGAGGGFTILLGAFVWLLRTVGLTVGKAIVDALKELVTAIHEHTAKDLEHHAEVKEAVVRLETKVDAMTDRRWEDLTPVERTGPRAVARESSTVYHVRPGTKEK